MTSEKNITNPGSQHPDRRLRASMMHALEVEAAAAWQRHVEEWAEYYTYHRPIHGWDGYMPDYLEQGWFFTFEDAVGYAYGDIHIAVRAEAERLFRQHQLGNRPNAAVWRRWLDIVAHVVTKRFAEEIDYDVARRLAQKFCFMYNLDFGFYFANGRAVFVLLDGKDLHPDWKVLADIDVRDRCQDDADYLRVVYAYNSYKRLLLRLHHTYVPLPAGEQSLEWVLAGEWRNTTLEEAQHIVSGSEE